jgi:hypothetical protein
MAPALDHIALRRGTPMQCTKLTDDELWRAIAVNTDTMSALLLEELKRDDSAINPCTRADLILFVNGQYSNYTAELRRRHHCPAGRSRDWFRTDHWAIKILLARLARCATIPAVIQYGVVAALISVMTVGALSYYGYGPYDYSYTAAPVYDYAGPASPVPVHAAVAAMLDRQPPGYGPLVYTPQVYAPTSMTSLSLMIVSALLEGGASLAVAQERPAGGQLPVADGATSKPAAPASTASIPARPAQHRRARHDRMYMMAVKAPIKVQN